MLLEGSWVSWTVDCSNIILPSSNLVEYPFVQLDSALKKVIYGPYSKWKRT